LQLYLTKCKAVHNRFKRARPEQKRWKTWQCLLLTVSPLFRAFQPPSNKR
jgi:hypothetical protein